MPPGDTPAAYICKKLVFNKRRCRRVLIISILNLFFCLSAHAVMKNGIVIASTRSEPTGNAIVTDPAVRRRKDTERGGTETKRRDGTSPLAGKETTESLLRWNSTLCRKEEDASLSRRWELWDRGLSFTSAPRPGPTFLFILLLLLKSVFEMELFSVHQQQQPEATRQRGGRQPPEAQTQEEQEEQGGQRGQ